MPQFNSHNEIRNYQNDRLRETLRYVAERSAFYRGHFAKHAVDISQINTLDHLAGIPVTTKEDLQRNNFEFLCVREEEIVEYCSTSGTLGAPVTIGLTEKDLQRLAHNEYLSFQCTGATASDIFLLMLSLDRQFMAGIAYFLGARELGAGIIRGGPGNHVMHLDTILRLRPTTLVAVPSFISSFITYASEKNIDLNTTSVKRIICIGENIRNEDFSFTPLGKKISDRWRVQLHSTYASTEQQNAFTECEFGCGGHHQPELVIFEVVDENDRPLPAGMPGELVITTLGVEGMPLIRYKTGDIVAYHDQPCRCGRITSRISPVIGRTQQLIKYRGTTLYPQTIFNAVHSIDGIADFIIFARKNDMNLDDIEIWLAANKDSVPDEQFIRNHFQSKLRIVPPFSFHSLEEIQQKQNIPTKRKLARFTDERDVSLK